MRNVKLTGVVLLLMATWASQARPQDKPLEWKFPSGDTAGTEDHATGLSFYLLEQGVQAAFKKVGGTTGAVVVLPGPRYGEAERRRIAAGGTDPDRMLTAMAVALVLPMPAEASDFFIAKEDWQGQSVYRWRTRNGAEACASAINLQPYSDEHDVLFVGSCALQPKEGTSIVTRNGERALEGFEDYIPRTLREIIRMHSDAKLLSGNPGSMILTGDTFSSRVKVTYTGASRKVAPARKQHLDMLVKSFNVKQEVIDRYDTEFLFMEGSDEHWLPILRKLVPLMEKELKKGEEVTLYTEWVGAKKIEGRWEWIFIVNEFQKQ